MRATAAPPVSPIAARLRGATKDPVAAATAAATAEGVRWRPRGDELEVDGLARLNAADRRLIERLMPEITKQLRPTGDDGEALLEALDIEVEYVTKRARVDEITAELPDEVGFDTETMPRPEYAIEPPWIATTRDGRVSQRQPSADPTKAALDPLRGQPRLVSIYDPGRRTTFVFDVVALGGYPTGLFDRHLVGQNLIFDLGFLAAQGIEPKSSSCTMQIAAMLLKPGERGLKEIAAQFLGLDVPKRLGASNWGAPELSTAQIAYAGADPAATYIACKRMHAILSERERTAFEVANRAIHPIVRMALKGLPINVDVHRHHIDEWHVEFADQREEFRQITGSDAPLRDPDVSAWLTGRLPAEALAGWERTKKTGLISIEAAEIKKMALDWPEVRPLLALRKAQKRLETFGESLLARVNPTSGRLHGNYHLPMITGRMSCSRPNLQNLPTVAREWVRAGEGKVLIPADLSQIELRVAAEDSGDPSMKAAFAAGEDLHARFTRTLLCPDYDLLPKAEQALQRKRGKAGHFGNLFAQTAPGFRKYAWKAFDLELSMAEAVEIQTAFYAMYPTIRDYQQAQFREGRFGTLYSIAGRPRRALWEKEGSMWLQLCANYRIQSSAADVLLTALHRVDRALPGTLVAAVHDELLLEVDEDQAEQAEAVLVEEMTAAFAEWFPNAPTSGLVETKICHCWADAKAAKG
jgi:DNA polymerase-1